MRETQRAALAQKALVQTDSRIQIFRYEVNPLKALDLRLNPRASRSVCKAGGCVRPNTVAIGSAPQPGRVCPEFAELSKHPLVETFFTAA